MDNLFEFIWYVPIGIALSFFLYWISKIVETQTEKIVEKARVDVAFKNDVLSWFYFIIEMGPNVSATAVVAIFIGGIDTILQLLGVFMFGIVMKHYGRRSRDLFMDVVRIEETKWE